MKPFTVPKVIFRAHSGSSAVLSFITSPGLSIRDHKSRMQLSSDSWNDLEGPSRSLAMTQFNTQQATYHCCSDVSILYCFWDILISTSLHHQELPVGILMMKLCPPIFATSCAVPTVKLSLCGASSEMWWYSIVVFNVPLDTL